MTPVISTVCAVLEGANLRAKSLTIADARCIAHREEGAGEAGGGAAGADIRLENMAVSFREKYFSGK